jgi:protein-L-isoaspartate(D-aspartate) O-methyltransferase
VEIDFARQSAKMIDDLLAKGIVDPRVIKAFEKVPRHLFVREEDLHQAYDDHPLPIGHGQTISQPYMVACMTELASLKGGEKVLEIGTGSGYQAAILAELAREVCTIERIPGLLTKARELLLSLGYKNIKFKLGDGTLGWEEEAPFDAIIVTAGSPEIPPSLISQLKEGGSLIIPVGEERVQQLLLVKKEAGGLKKEEICACVFVKLIGKEGWEE